MDVFDILPSGQREFISNLDFNLLDDHIMLGPREIDRVQAYLENGGEVTLHCTSGKN